MSNRWVDYCKKYAKENDMPYSCAVSKASASYREKYDVKPKKKKKETPQRLPEGQYYIPPVDIKRNAYIMAKKAGYPKSYEEYIR